MRRRLAPGGAVAANLIGVGQSFKAQVADLRAAFGDTAILSCGPAYNRIVLATAEPGRLQDRAPVVAAARALTLPWDLASAIESSWWSGDRAPRPR